MQNYHQPLMPSQAYHLFSRAVGREKLFIEEKNYSYFLDRLNFHTGTIADIFTYALLPNHFHLLVRIKPAEIIINHFEIIKKKKFDPRNYDISDFIMERFSNLLNSYTKSVNKMYNRKGALFIDYLKRTKVEKESDFASYLFYIHKNAVHHNYSKKIGDWKFDAFQSLTSNKPTNLLRAEILEWFGGKEKFVEFHNQPIHVKPKEFEVSQTYKVLKTL